MNLYITQAQANSMRVNYCLRCHKIRELAFWQMTPSIPIVLSVSDGEMARSVKIQEFCICQEQQQICQQCGKSDLPLNQQTHLCVRCVIDNEAKSLKKGE